MQVKPNSKMAFLMDDLKIIHNKFLSSFENIDTKIDLFGSDVDENPEYLFFTRFPLPDFFTNKENKKFYYCPDKENIFIDIHDYPKTGPKGIHVRRDSPNLAIIGRALNVKIDMLKLKRKDLRYPNWLLLSFQNPNWDYHKDNLKQGDCLASFIETLWRCFSREIAENTYQSDYQYTEEIKNIEIAYQILGVKTDSNLKDVKSAFFELSKKYHPDKFNYLGMDFQKLAHDKMVKINEAYEYIKYALEN